MRFHIGFSKYLKLSTLLKFGILMLGIFGLNSCVVHAQSFDTIQNWSWCSFNATTYNASGCNSTTSSNLTTGSINNISGVVKPFTSWYINQGHTGKEKHTEFYKYGGTTGCSTGDTISLYVDLVMNDVNNTLPNNTLDYSQWPTSPIVRSGNTRDLSYNNFYQWVANNGDDLTNRVGVSVLKSDGTSSSNCSFVSYGSNKSIRYMCNVASGSTGYQIKLNLYNNNGTNSTNSSLSGTQVVSGVKTTILNDPCMVTPNTQQGVIDSINDQTSSVMEGIGGIIDNQNSNASQQHKDSNDILNELKDFHNDVMDDSISANANINTSWMNYPTKIENIIYMPVSILRTIKGTIDNATCTSPTIDFSSIMQRWGDPLGGISNTYTLSFPCMRDKLPQLLGTDFYNLVDYLLCAVLVYNFCIHLYKKFDDALSGSDHLIDDYYLRDTNMVGAYANYLGDRGGTLM